MDSCLFCGIIQGKIPSKKSLETEQILAFHDINPQAPVHILIIPKLHIHSVMEIEECHHSLLGEMFKVAREVAKSEGVDSTGFRLVFNCGSNAGQAVDHLHLHLLGKRRLSWPPG